MGEKNDASAEAQVVVAQSLAGDLADWALALRFNDAPAEVKQSLQNCLLYNLSMALAVDEPADALGQALRRVATSTGSARLVGGRGTRSAADAAFINASLITARGQNDTHPRVVTHIGCIVIPAVLAVAGQVRASDERLRDALLVGYEAIPRIADALAAKSSRAGFRASAIYGAFGAALACAVLLGLSRDATRNAISIATHTASGLLQTWADGSQEWRFQIAKTSRDGVHAALLAQAGVSGSTHCLEGASGFGKAYAGTVPVLDLTGWHTPDVTFKPYPGCAFNQAPVQALKDFLGSTGTDPKAIARIEVHMNPADAAYPGVALHGPFDSPSGAIMSAPFMLAATLLDGQPKVRHFEEQNHMDAMHALSRHIHVHPCASVRPWLCAIDVTTTAGQRLGHSFDVQKPFQLDWRQTQALALQVSQEWPCADRLQQFERLRAGVEAVFGDGRSGLAQLEGVIYA